MELSTLNKRMAFFKAGMEELARQMDETLKEARSSAVGASRPNGKRIKAMDDTSSELARLMEVIDTFPSKLQV